MPIRQREFPLTGTYTIYRVILAHRGSLRFFTALVLNCCQSSYREGCKPCANLLPAFPGPGTIGHVHDGRRNRDQKRPPSHSLSRTRVYNPQTLPFQNSSLQPSNTHLFASALRTLSTRVPYASASGRQFRKLQHSGVFSEAFWTKSKTPCKRTAI
jgi:hypothetical protein